MKTCDKHRIYFATKGERAQELRDVGIFGEKCILSVFLFFRRGGARYDMAATFAEGNGLLFPISGFQFHRLFLPQSLQSGTELFFDNFFSHRLTQITFYHEELEGREGGM
jgi:hypothetical protein